MMPPFTGLGPVDHVGIAVMDLERSHACYREAHGATLVEIEEVADQKARADEPSRH